MNILFLSENDSRTAKGGALLLLLWHHLFYMHPEYGWFVHYSSVLSKFCVTMFLLLSGYGLAKVFVPEQCVFQFYFRRMSKLYVTYWFIFAIGVPISMLLTGVTIESAFSSVHHPYLAFVLHFFGLSMFYGGSAFNGSWWFMSAIIPFYLLFPFFFVMIDKYSWWGLLVCLLCTAMPNLNIPILQPWIFPFVLGIFLARWNISKDSIWNNKIATLPRLIAVFTVLTMLSLLLKKYGGSFSFIRIFLRFDLLMALTAIYFFVYLARLHKIIHIVLQVFGEYSFIIFLSHSFLYYRWFPHLFYRLKHPLLIMLGLAVASLLFAILLKSLHNLFVESVRKLIIRMAHKECPVS